ncbi:MAG: hypothetical protein KAQ89_00375 [Planctomycetes bacterium]|nr:hypothetical protein [Planctomycetota bacterium]
MVPESILFVPRGEVLKSIEFQGATLNLKLKVMTNKEADSMKEGFVSMVGQDVEIDTSGLAEEIIKIGLLDINTTFNGKTWLELSDAEKLEAISSMHPDLRDDISREVMAKSYITKEEKGFLSKRS